MWKKILPLFLFLASVILLTSSFTQCSTEIAPPKQRHYIYVLNAEEFDAFCKEVSSTKTEDSVKENPNRTSAKEMMIGETYYIVAYSWAQTFDESILGFYDGKISLSASLSSGNAKTPVALNQVMTILNTGSATAGNAWATLSPSSGTSLSESVDPAKYNLSVEADNDKAGFYTYFEIQMKAEASVKVEYTMNITNASDSTRTIYTETPSRHSKQVQINHLDIGYLEEEDYVDGKYEEKNLRSSLDMKVGRTYYMVISSKISNLLNGSSQETLTLTVHFPSLTVADGTLEFASSADFSELMIESEKKISITVPMPSPEEESKELQCIIKIIPISLGTQDLHIEFSSNKISVFGTKEQTKSILVNGEEKISEGFDYQLSADKTYYTLVDIGTVAGTNLLIPSTYEGLPVKAVASRAFVEFKTIRSIEISEGIEDIAADAFKNCSGLLWVKFPSTAVIHPNTLSGCTSVIELTANMSNLQVKEVFGGRIPNSLKSVFLTGDTALCDQAFEGGSGIEVIRLPSTVVSVGKDVFKDCASLKTLEMTEPSSAFFTQSGVLYETSSNQVFGFVRFFSGEIRYPSGITAITGGDMTAVTDIEVPESVKNVNGTITGLAPVRAVAPSFIFSMISSKKNLEEAVVLTADTIPSFQDAENLVHVQLPNSITEIPASTFENCKKLKSFHMPEGVSSIGESAFAHCESLTELKIPSDAFSIGQRAFAGCKNLRSIEIPFGMMIIPNELCSGCESLTSIKIPWYVIEIRAGAFENCTNLSSVSFSERLLSIGDRSFAGCRELSSVSLPDGIKKIGDDAFAESGLTSFCIPKSTQSIGTGAFRSCRNLETISISEGNTWFQMKNEILYNQDQTKIIHVSANISGTVSLPGTLTAIRSWDFENRTKITKVVIPESVQFVEAGSFTTCTALESVEFTNKNTIMTYDRESGSYVGYVFLTNAADTAAKMKGEFKNRHFGDPQFLRQ